MELLYVNCPTTLQIAWKKKSTLYKEKCFDEESLEFLKVSRVTKFCKMEMMVGDIKMVLGYFTSGNDGIVYK